MSDTSIQWTHLPGHRGVTWNPVRGCSRVSPGCKHCYAEVLAGRFSGADKDGKPLAFHGYATKGSAGARWTRKVDLLAHKLAEPLGWREPRCCFVNSMSDLFHEELSFEEIAAVIGVIAACPGHQFLVLTKRAERMRWALERIESKPQPRTFAMSAAAGLLARFPATHKAGYRVTDKMLWEDAAWPLPNLWLGVSAEDQQRWDERVPDLLRCPAAVRFVSAEPLLGAIDCRPWISKKFLGTGGAVDGSGPPPCVRETGLDQVIVGAESGKGARPMSIEWARSIRDQCQEAAIAFFMKQMATKRGKKIGDPEAFPADLRIRQWPKLAAEAVSNG